MSTSKLILMRGVMVLTVAVMAAAVVAQEVTEARTALDAVALAKRSAAEVEKLVAPIALCPDPAVQQQVVIVTNTVVQIGPSDPQIIYVMQYNPDSTWQVSPDWTG